MGWFIERTKEEPSDFIYILYVPKLRILSYNDNCFRQTYFLLCIQVTKGANACLCMVVGNVTVSIRLNSKAECEETDKEKSWMTF